MGKHTFIEFVGNSWISGKAVAAYRVDAETVQLRAETTGGKIISKIKNVTNAEFEELKEAWRDGSVNHQDAAVVNRGLTYLGVL